MLISRLTYSANFILTNTNISDIIKFLSDNFNFLVINSVIINSFFASSSLALLITTTTTSDMYEITISSLFLSTSVSITSVFFLYLIR